jgi:hypothetical protein
MRILNLIIIIVLFASCSHKLNVSEQPKSIIELINNAGNKNKKSKNNLGYGSRIYEMRQKAVQLYSIETDTSKINRFIVIDIGNLEGADFYGEMILNDTARYFYEGSYRLGTTVEKYQYPVESEKVIVEYLKAHQFKELEQLANKKGEGLSGSGFIYVGMYEKGMDSIYIKSLPAFITN